MSFATIIGSLTGVVTSGFGIFKAFRLLKMGLRVKKFLKKSSKEISQFLKQAKDVAPAVKKLNDLRIEIYEDKKLTKPELQALSKQTLRTAEEILEAYEEFKDVMALRDEFMELFKK